MEESRLERRVRKLLAVTEADAACQTEKAEMSGKDAACQTSEPVPTAEASDAVCQTGLKVLVRCPVCLWDMPASVLKCKFDNGKKYKVSFLFNPSLLKFLERLTIFAVFGDAQISRRTEFPNAGIHDQLEKVPLLRTAPMTAESKLCDKVRQVV